ncbi:MAG: hypothetical protein F6K36_30730, partial [Symploca sp. SIO3C6]|nr:hypothetical protein [Symploca sp. SIO3C6]
AHSQEELLHGDAELIIQNKEDGHLEGEDKHLEDEELLVGPDLVSSEEIESDKVE